MTYTDSTLSTDIKNKYVHLTELVTAITALQKKTNSAGTSTGVALTNGPIITANLKNLQDAIHALQNSYSGNCCQANCCQTCQTYACQSCQACQACQSCQSSSCQSMVCQSGPSCQACQYYKTATTYNCNSN